MLAKSSFLHLLTSAVPAPKALQSPEFQPRIVNPALDFPIGQCFYTVETLTNRTPLT